MANWGMSIAGLASTKEMLDTLEGEWSDMETRTVVADAPHAVYIEYGTSRIPADGSLRDAIEATMADVDRLAGQASSADELVRLIAEDIAEGYSGSVPVDTGELRDSVHVEKA